MNSLFRFRLSFFAALLVMVVLNPSALRAEAILQVFNQSHNEIAARLPEIAEAGYTALWVPPPTKANGGLSVGYDLNDPFDIGNSDLRGTWSTRYGVEADLHNLIATCHRFGLRVYFDNVMNHRSYDIPGYNESTPIDVYPGMCPEDFHLRTTSDGFYRKWDNVRSWDDEWQVMFLGLSDLLDIAHESPNQNFGAHEGDWHDKPFYVRHPNNPEYYDRMPNFAVDPSLWNPSDWSGDTNSNIYVGFGVSNGITTNMLAEYPDFFKEDVGGYLCRAVRWLVDRTKVDGLRLDAVKHVPYYFFGEAGNDASSAGYVGNVQWQFNMSRGFNDWANHRDSVFNVDVPRDDAMMFGEHLGAPPPQGPYVDAGMRLVDDRLRNELNWRFSANELTGFDNDGAGSDLGSACGVMHAQSHDNDYVDRKPLHHAFYFMHKGLGLVYSDGNNHAATLSGSGGAFPRWAQTDFLGQWNQRQIPTLLHAHENFARDDQIGKWSQGNFLAWQRGGTGANWATMLFMINSGWDFWDYAHTKGDFDDGAYLYDYASDMYMPHIDDGSWAEAPYAYGSQIASSVKLPENSYAIWSWKNPDPSDLYPSPYPECFVDPDPRLYAPDSRVVTLLEDGRVVDPVYVTRKDGVDGDPNFNPYHVADTNDSDYAYSIAIPRVTKGTNVTLAVKADGSAEHLYLRLDGGMDFGNGISGYGAQGEDWRDNPPGSAVDLWLGFENCSPFFTRRIWPELFASTNADACKVGSAGASSYEVVIGASTNATDSSDHNNQTTGWGQLAYVYHDPAGTVDHAASASAAAPRTPGDSFTDAASAASPVAAKSGFGEMSVSAYAPEGAAAGMFVGDPSAAGISGLPAASYGLYAKNSTDAGVVVSRALACPAGEMPVSFSIALGLNWDSDAQGSYRGFVVYDDAGNDIFGVQMQNSQAVTYHGGASGTWSSGYGTDAFTVSLSCTTGGLYSVWGTTRDGQTVTNIAFAAEPIAGYRVYMNGIRDGYDERQIYFNNASYTTAARPAAPSVTNQFSASEAGVTVYAKAAAHADVAAWLYYTVDGAHWPEGAAGVPGNPATIVVPGTFSHNGAGASDWWRFRLPALADGTVLRYKIGAAPFMGDANGWDIVWPSNADAVLQKTKRLSLWTIPGLNFLTQSYHRHNDYTSWTTGFEDGFHLVTARLFLNRLPTDGDGAGNPIPNTFRQTFYLDLHTPEGEFLYPSEASPRFEQSEYGLILKTDNTVQDVWYHIEDSSADNDGPGNGLNASNRVEWAPAVPVGPWTKEMAQDTRLTKIWRFNYSRIPASGSAVIRVRLREVSSAPVSEWSASSPAADDLDALHVTELVKNAETRGPAESFFFEWPDADGMMVEAGWTVRIRFTSRMVAGLSDSDIFSRFRIYANSSSNGSKDRGELLDNGDLEMSHQWEWGDNGEGLNTLTFRMPNVYNGIENWLYSLVVDFDNSNGYGDFSKSATRLFTHRGPLLPTCIVTTPPEVDSDGAKYIITMEDSVNASIPSNRPLRETPLVVLTDSQATNLSLSFLSPTGYVASISASPSAPFPSNSVLRLESVASNGSTFAWTFAWQVTNAGLYRFEARVAVRDDEGRFASLTNSAFRSATIRFRQLVHAVEGDADWDDDGIGNDSESVPVPLPETQSEYWTQNQIFSWYATGKTQPLCPDSDGDGLPDALELGYRVAAAGTDASADTNGDGWPNFVWDRDPPFYNSCESNYGKVPGVTSSTEGGDRCALVKGSVTDPNNPDSDYDGLPDGVEDANVNGWVDGDGEIIPADWEPWSGRNWPDGKIGPGEVWEETSPSIADSDGDGLSDGYGEDVNANGFTDLFLRYENGDRVALSLEDCARLGVLVDKASSANSSSLLAVRPRTSRAIDYDALFARFNVEDPNGPDGSMQTNGWPRLVIAETDPLCTDTDHDGLPDGWEVRYSLDPLNSGVYDFRNGEFTDDPTHGPLGNPDGDTYVYGGEIRPYANLAEYVGGTNPRSSDSSDSPAGEGSITIGDGEVIGSVNGRQYFNEFLDWSLDDLIALDDYNQGGNSADIYRFGDGFDSSRDMVAFYVHDGGDIQTGGDGKLYFRVDFDDLLPYAEENALNIYVAINFGNYGNGITAFPDQVNCDSAMKWNACVGVYDSQNGVLYTQNSGENYQSVGGFQGAYFNSELDSVAWSIDRSKLSDAGWNGIAENLLFQVFTTRDFTNDDGGSGDKGGLNDFADTIGDDWLCSDYWNDYNYISNHELFSWCVGRNTSSGHAFNSCGQHAKLALVAHGNQAVEPGSVIQSIVDNGSGAGYQRPVKIHNIYSNCPLNLHITPTLAMALEWAAVGNGNSWLSGPALNAQIRSGVSNGTFALLGSTFSDHIPKYFPSEFNAADVALSTEVLETVYGAGAVSTNVFWLPERVADWTSFHRVADLGFRATVIDQTPHLQSWLGRSRALGNDAYKIQRFWLAGDGACEMKAFALSSAANGFRYVNTDSGLPSDLRRLFLRRARSGEVAVSSIFYMWEELAQNANADAYDANLRWLANHPWIRIVSLDEALADERLSSEMAYADLDASAAPQAHDWVHHACNGNYDNWFYGSARHEGLAPKVFEVRQGVALPSATAYGTATNGILARTWERVAGITNASVRRLARMALFASVFESAFHQESNSDLSRWSYGDYMFPATGWEGLQSFSWRAQSATRRAAVYAEVDAWANASPASVQVLAKDVDLDGEPEYILRNASVMAVFEREGGLMVGAWMKSGDRVFQMVGNPVAIPENGYEDEEPFDVAYSFDDAGARHAAVSAQRASALKDISVGSANLVRNLFSVSTNASSLSFSDSGLVKTVSLASGSASAFDVAYSAPGKSFYVRCALSPDLDSLLVAGQSVLSESSDAPGSLTLSTRCASAPLSVSATLDVTSGAINTEASDQPSEAVESFSTVNMRNMAQTRQVELSGTDSMAFSLGFSVKASSEPPVIVVSPDADVQVFPAGVESSFSVSASDGALSVAELPSLVGVTASFANGLFSWSVPVLSLGERTNDVSVEVVFSASNAAGVSNRAVTVLVPWDSDADGLGDDWEMRKFGSLEQGPSDDFDGDGFSNGAEYVAGTNPDNPGDYIGWTHLVRNSDGSVALSFNGVSNATYRIEYCDSEGLVAGSWIDIGPVVCTNDVTTWTDASVTDADHRNYRIRIPFSSVKR